MEAVIYKATNKITGKSYVGFDSAWPNRRRTHLNTAFNPKAKRYDVCFSRAIREYGKDAFDWEVIYKHWDPKFCLRVMEPMLIDALDTFACGYNLTEGGEGTIGRVVSQETREKQRLGNLGKHKDFKHTEEAKEKIRVAGIGRKLSEEHRESLKNSRIGYRSSQETLDKMRQVQLGKKHSPETIEKIKKYRHSDETRKKMSLARTRKVGEIL